MTERKALFIANQKSGRAQPNELEGAVRILEESGMVLIKEESEDPAHINELIRQRRNEVAAVVLAGGDGTMSSAAGTLSECGLALGILPTGTANDLARTLAIPESPEAAAAIIAEGRLHAIDLGKVNDRFFINAAHIGLGVRVNRNLTPDLKSRWGRFSYAKSLIDSFRSMRSYRADIVCDGESFSVHSIHITVANGRFYGGGMALSEEAAVDDHKLGLFSLEPQSFWSFLSHSVVMLGRKLQGREGVFLRSGERIRIHTSKILDIWADGEFISQTPACFELRPNGLQVYVPEHYFKQEKTGHAEN